MSFKTLEENFKDLLKLDPSLSQALQVTRQILPQAADVFARKLFTDTLVPKMGNLLAYRDFLTRHSNDGVHVHVDLNRFGEINKLHGDTVGDEAIKLAGNVMSESSRLARGKSFRPHGDELKAWFPTVDQAHFFAREFRNRLEKIPKIGTFNPNKHPQMGVTPDYNGHNVSACIGLGFNPEHAEQALINAKSQLGPKELPSTFKKGEAPNIIHSSLHETPPEGWKLGKKNKEDIQEISEPHIPAHLTIKNPLE